MRLDDVFGLGVVNHRHYTVANDDFEDISREGCAVENPDFLLVGEGDLHGSLLLDCERFGELKDFWIAFEEIFCCNVDAGHLDIGDFNASKLYTRLDYRTGYFVCELFSDFVFVHAVFL
jgi:hypothetical protein